MHRNSCIDFGCLAFTHVTCCITVACRLAVYSESMVTVDSSKALFYQEPKKLILSCAGAG